MEKLNLPDSRATFAEIPVADIAIEDGDDIDPAEVQRLAESIKIIGLLHPVNLTEDGEPSGGGRKRVAAFKLLGRKTIPAFIRRYDNVHRELAQLDENLLRRHLSAITEGELLLRRDKLLTQLGLRAKAGQNQHTRRGSASVAPPKTTKDIARELGVGERNLQLKKQIARDLEDSVKEKIRTAPLSNNVRALLEISKLSAKQQAKLAAKLSGNEDRDSVDRKIHAVNREEKIRHAHKKAGQFKGIEGFEWFVGDFAEICSSLENNSIDLITTDPPYPPKFLPLWKKLGAMAYRTLRPSRFLIAYSGKNHLPTVINYLLESGLQYYWMITIAYLDNRRMPTIDKNVYESTRPVLIFQKPPSKAASHAFVDLICCQGQKEKDLHPWQQLVDHSQYLIKHFSEPNDVILDPFAGVGTVALAALIEKRRCISMDIKEENIKTAKGRLQTYIEEEKQKKEN